MSSRGSTSFLWASALALLTQGTGVWAQVVRPVSLQAVTQDSVTLVWHTTELTQAIVEYGPTLSYGYSTESKLPSREHSITLRRLLPGSLYYYRVRTEDTILYEGPEYHFRTVPDKRATQFRFVVFGDTGKGTAGQFSLVPGLVASDPDFILHAGDVIYPDGEPENFDPRYFVPYEEILRNTPVWLALGNHDMRTASGLPYLDAFHLPLNGPGNDERVYSLDYGQAHIVVLDSNVAPDSDLLDWLDRDLRNATTTWTFVVLHHPPYSCGQHGSDYTLRSWLAPIFEEHKVDIVFAGHDHDYQRSYPMRDGSVQDTADDPNYTHPQGVVYIVTGAGAEVRATSSGCSFTSVAQSIVHFVQVDLNEELLELRAIDATGQILDEFSIDKRDSGMGFAPSPSKPPRFLGGTPNPFNPRASLGYELPRSGRVRLVLYDLAGREVRVLENGFRRAGLHQVAWDGRDTSGRSVASGVYLAQLQWEGIRVTGKVVVAK